MSRDVSLYEDHAAEWWTGQASFLRQLRALAPVRLAYLDALVPRWQSLRVADVGCGGGYMAEALVRRGAIVVGVDPSGGTISAARAHATVAGLGIDYRQGCAEELPIADGFADLIVAADVLEHVEDLRRSLAEVARVLHPGGLFFYDTINRTPAAWLVVVLLGERLLRFLPRGTHDPRKFLRPGELAESLRDHGLRPSRPVGLGPVGFSWRGDLKFGRLPCTAVMFMGHARRATARSGDPCGCWSHPRA